MELLYSNQTKQTTEVSYMTRPLPRDLLEASKKGDAGDDVTEGHTTPIVHIKEMGFRVINILFYTISGSLISGGKYSSLNPRSCFSMTL